MSSKITAVITQANITGNITHQSINANVGVGVAGKSAYESALEGGFIGTEEDFNEAFTTMTTLDDYALITHNHDSSYSALTHNHNANYSDINHNHTGVYQVVIGADENYVTDNEKSALHEHLNKTALDNVSGTNTGDQDISGKQDVLVSGTNIKTVNSNSLLGSGDIAINANISYLENELTNDVTLTNSTTYYDGPAITLTPGTWLVIGRIVHFKTTTTAAQLFGRLTDGTNHYDHTQQYHPSAASSGENLYLQSIITVANNTSVKLQCAASSGAVSSFMKATINMGSGAKATRITAIKLS